MHVAHLVASRQDGEDQYEFIDFTPTGMQKRWEAGYADTLRMIERSTWAEPAYPIEGVIECH